MEQKQTFSLVSHIDVEKTCFLMYNENSFGINVNLYQSQEHISRSNRSQKFFERGALKNFAMLMLTY